jgi:hypothetical protein
VNQLTLFLVLILIVLLTPGCKDTGSTEPHWVDYLGGRIEDWQTTTGSNTAYFSTTTADNFATVILDSSKVSEQGDFGTVLSSLTPPPSTFRRLVTRQDSTQYYTIHDARVLSNPAAGYTLLWVSCTDHGRGFGRYLYSGNALAEADSLVRVGDFQVLFFYFSQPTVITGQYAIACFDSAMIKQLYRERLVTDYAVNASAGWNRVVTMIVSDDGHTRRYQVTAASCVTGVKWFSRSPLSIAFQGAGGLF